MLDWLVPFGDMLLQIVLPSLATIVGGLIVGLLNKQLKKAGIELTQAQQDRVKELIQDAIRATEEAARREHMTSEEKRAKAIVAATLAITSAPSIPDMPREEIEAALDSQLPIVRKEDGRQ